jgi:integrase
MGKHSNYTAIDGHHNYYRTGSGLITFRKRINGIQHTISTGSKSIKEAKQKVDQKLIDLFSANPSQERRKRQGITNPLISAIWVDLMGEKHPVAELSTRQNYHASWKYSIEPFWGNLTVMDVNPTNIKKWEAWYLKTLGNRTFFNSRKHFVMLLRYMKRQNMITSEYPVSNLDEVIIKKTKKKVVGRIYTDKEIDALLLHATSFKIGVAIMIYRNMGLRKDELLRAEKANWDMKAGIATVWSQKNKKWRQVPIPDFVLLPLKALIDETDSKYLYPMKSDSERYMSSQLFDKEWTRTKELAEIKDWDQPDAARIHDLRHTLAHQTKIDNWNPLIACEMLDMSLKIYQKIYGRVSVADIQSEMGKSFGGSK